MASATSLRARNVPQMYMICTHHTPGQRVLEKNRGYIDSVKAVTAAFARKRNCEPEHDSARWPEVLARVFAGTVLCFILFCIACIGAVRVLLHLPGAFSAFLFGLPCTVLFTRVSGKNICGLFEHDAHTRQSTGLETRRTKRARTSTCVLTFASLGSSTAWTTRFGPGHSNYLPGVTLRH